MPVRNDSKTWEQLNWSPPYGIYPSTGPTRINTYVRSFNNELVVSGGNNGIQIRKGLRFRSGDVGGNFLVRRRLYSEFSTLGKPPHHFSTTTNPQSSGTHSYTGHWARYSSFSDTAFPMPTPSSDIQMNALGTTAIARTAPTKAKADLATFLGETREGFPSAVGLSMFGKERARRAKNAGDEYLNIEFGWKPLLRDVRMFASAVKNSHEILAAYRRKSGVLLKRRYAWPVESTTERLDLGFRQGVPILPSQLYGGGGSSGRCWQTNKSETKQWFTASFIYYVPDRTLPEKWVADANQLLGAKLTPDMLWNLAPWSWAADWVGNVGDIMANLSYLQTDNLAMHHCYVMETKTLSSEFQLEYGVNNLRTYPGPQTFRQTFTGQTKKRTVGTPYGFGLSWDGFNTKQLAILGALGISKAR